jgi:hypothetical protein
MPRLNPYRIVPTFMLALALLPPLAAALQPAPAVQAAKVPDSTLDLLNDTVGVRVTVKDGRMDGLSVTDRRRVTSLTIAIPFAILLKDGTIYDARNLRISDVTSVHALTPNPAASRLAERHSRQSAEISFESANHSLRGVWSIVLRSGSNYVRQEVTITADGVDLAIRRVQLIDLLLPDAHVSGSVDGSPIVSGQIFLGFEHPLSKSRVTGNRATAWIDRDLPLRAGQSVTYSSVIGVARDGQMRRDFLAYLEQERAHPYRTFLHYNSWYDLGFFTPYTEADAIDRVNAFGRELKQKRGVKLDSFLFDDGWDNHRSLWKFNGGFPNGFASVKTAAEKFNADPGVWMSPWGGYSKPKQERMEFAKAAGYEVVANGYALSGSKYYDAFRDVCIDMIHTYGVNQFKFDGTGNVNSVLPGSRFDSDFDAAIHLISELRKAKPDIFINLTTGTWPSPFWVMYADSIWRGGEDDSTAGVGSYRERWITYRDAQTYQGVVQGGPLYPLNSLMLHGLIFGQFHKDLKQDPGNDFRNEVRSYFGTGTQLQEMYITPALLTQQNWDDLAEAANWSRKNSEVLKDTHWIGGDPEWLEVYGWASWTPKKGILVLRNPSNREQSVNIKLQDAFELPAGAAQVYAAQSPWKDDAGRPAIELDAKEAHEFHLAPFQVLTLDILPKQTVHD